MANKILFISCALFCTFLLLFGSSSESLWRRAFQRREGGIHHAGLRFLRCAIRFNADARAAYPNKRDGLQGRRNKDAAKRTLGGTSLRLSFFVFSRTAEYFAIPILACKGRMFCANDQVPLHYFPKNYAAAFLIFS